MLIVPKVFIGNLKPIIFYLRCRF